MTAVTLPEVGSLLPNGARVLAVKRSPLLSTDKTPALIVLALVHEDGQHGGEFVTWAMEADTGMTYWGHYHQTDLRDALADFDERGEE